MNAISAVPLTLLGLFVAFILTKKYKSPSDFILLTFNFVLITIVVFDLNFVKNNISGTKLLIHFNSIFWLSTTFLIYAYSLLSKSRTIVTKWWFFAFSLPFFLFSFGDLVLNKNHTNNSLLHTLTDPGLVYQLFFKLHKVFIIIVCLFLLKKIKNYEKELKNTFSRIENISLNWLKNYVILIIGVYVFHLVIFSLYTLGVLTNIELPYMITGIATIIASFYLSFFGIKFYNFPVEENIPKNVESNEKANLSKTTNQFLKSAENEIIFNKVKTLFKEEETFKEPELRIGKVADRIDIPVHKVSEAINEQFKKPFYHFVAHHRCESLKEKLRNPQYANYTILGLAMDVGFNSKSSLNRIFKEQTGQTPSQYRKSHLPK